MNLNEIKQLTNRKKIIIKTQTKHLSNDTLNMHSIKIKNEFYNKTKEINIFFFLIHKTTYKIKSKKNGVNWKIYF